MGVAKLSGQPPPDSIGLFCRSPLFLLLGLDLGQLVLRRVRCRRGGGAAGRVPVGGQSRALLQARLTPETWRLEVTPDATVDEVVQLPATIAKALLA